MNDPPSAPRWPLRPLTVDDLEFAVTQHLHHFPNGFFARLGRSFMLEYYRAFLTSGSAIAWAAEFQGRLVGYLVGTTNPPRHRDHVIRAHGRRLALRAGWALVCRPGLALIFIRTRAGLYARKLILRTTHQRSCASCTVRSSRTVTTAVLTHIAIAPNAQGLGFGRSLIDQFAEQAELAGCERILLVTAAQGGAGAYYLKNGWTATDEHTTPDGLTLALFELSLPRETVD